MGRELSYVICSENYGCVCYEEYEADVRENDSHPNCTHTLITTDIRNNWDFGCGLRSDKELVHIFTRLQGAELSYDVCQQFKAIGEMLCALKETKRQYLVLLFE